MPDEKTGRSRFLRQLRTDLGRLVQVRDGEIQAMLASCAFFFWVLASNYVIRPLRDEMGVSTGDALSWLFIFTFVGTVLLNPLFGTLVSRFSRRTFIPIVYRVVAATLLLAYVLLRFLPEASTRPVAQALFVWASVYNLLLVSLFWGFMADVFRSEQGKRLFGFIALGGSVGGVAGSSTASLAPWIGSLNLLLVAAVSLEAALFFMRRVARAAGPEPARAAVATLSPWRGMADGFRLLAKSRYLQGIALFILFYALSSTLLYFEQRDIVGSSIANRDHRTAFFARIDLVTNVLSLVFQGYVTGRFLPKVGLTAGLLVMPAISMVGLGLLEAWRSLWLLFAVQVSRRACEYGLVKPAREVLWTVTTREEKYTAKQLVDVPIYRGGDVVGAWWEKGMTLLGLGLRGMTITFVPFALVWVGLSFWLGRRQRALAARRETAEVAASVEASRA